MPPIARASLHTFRYDWGSPDFQDGPKKNLKYRLIVEGVQKLIEKDGLDPSKVGIWIDWQARRPPPPLAAAAAHSRPAPAHGAVDLPG